MKFTTNNPTVQADIHPQNLPPKTPPSLIPGLLYFLLFRVSSILSSLSVACARWALGGKKGTKWTDALQLSGSICIYSVSTAP